MTRVFSFLFLGLIPVFAGLCDLSAKPNVLFIAIDDLNDYVSPLDNHPGVKTPHFERLAKRSVNFANAHCAANPEEACPAKWSPGAKTLTPSEGMVGNVYEALND